jgi:hypothetical protein
VYVVFFILFFITIAMLVVGMIKPGQRKDGTPYKRKHLAFDCGFFALIFFVLMSVTAPQSPSKPQTASLTAASHSAAAKTLGDSITTQQVTETKPVAFTTTTQDDASLPKGQTKILQTGKDGVETLTYKVTYTNGQQTDKTLLSDDVTTQPVDQIVADGTYVAAARKSAPATPTPSPATPTTPTQSCYPLTNGGNCYKPGEYCRNSDHGVSGIAGNGEAIICTDNNGWRWEPN